MDKPRVKIKPPIQQSFNYSLLKSITWVPEKLPTDGELEKINKLKKLLDGNSRN